MRPVYIMTRAGYSELTLKIILVLPLVHSLKLTCSLKAWPPVTLAGHTAFGYVLRTRGHVHALNYVNITD